MVLLPLTHLDVLPDRAHHLPLELSLAPRLVDELDEARHVGVELLEALVLPLRLLQPLQALLLVALLRLRLLHQRVQPLLLRRRLLVPAVRLSDALLKVGLRRVGAAELLLERLAFARLLRRDRLGVLLEIGQRALLLGLRLLHLALRLHAVGLGALLPRLRILQLLLELPRHRHRLLPLVRRLLHLRVERLHLALDRLGVLRRLLHRRLVRVKLGALRLLGGLGGIELRAELRELLVLVVDRAPRDHRLHLLLLVLRMEGASCER